MKLAALITAVLVLSACGSPESPDPDTDSAAQGADAAAAAGDSAAPAAAQTPAEPANCPPELSSPAPGPDAPVDDILGVRPGQTFDEVEALLRCRDEGYTIEVADRWLVRDTGGLPTRQVLRATNGVPCTGQEIARDMGVMGGQQKCVGGFSGSNFRSVRDTTDEIQVAFTGLMDAEVAGVVWRSRSYADDGRPSVANLEQALIDKYGEPSSRAELPTRNWNMNKGDVQLTWVYDLRGRKVGRDNPAHVQCVSFYPTFAGTHRWSPACGLTLHAGIQKNRTNNLLADALHVGVMNQKAFYDAGQQFEADIASAVEAARRKAAQEAEAVATEL